MVLHENAPLPGTTVRLLERGEVRVQAFTDIDGRFLFDSVPGGYYELEVSLEGMIPVTSDVYVNGGESAVEPVSLEIEALAETITMGCHSPCGGDGEPTCEEYTTNRDLEAVAARDSHVLEQLRERYRHTSSRAERARIGSFLIGVLDEDDYYFRPLAESTETLLAFAERSDAPLNEQHPDYTAWCHLTGRDRMDELWMLYEDAAALIGSTDLKAVPFAHRALASREWGLRSLALEFAGLTCEPSLLKTITDNFESLAESGGAYSIAQVVPCGDRVLNAKLIDLDREYVERVLPDIIERRDSELARLRPDTR
ncbi:MAG: carboxypeptidase regulatory-like domain-containing protein [Acidobacteria bacterium]|nr:carboxypeptidase regulatory-like domain-containing protein [Acidobacteriota bacterium]